jgi:hypothetical protein
MKILQSLIALALLSFSLTVSADEGGIAGAASFLLIGGVVTDASTAVAVGKSSAYAGSDTVTDTSTEAFATGTGGVITFTGNDIYIESIAEDTALGTAQANDLNSFVQDIDVSLGTISQDINVETAT